jgi:uncharacterized protein (DUF2235 family)
MCLVDLDRALTTRYTEGMGKRIVLCIDGTNNDPLHGRTNVSRFFRMLCKAPGEQVVYYQPGVGTLDPESARSSARLWLGRVWDLATAWLIGRHVASAYRFLMDCHEEGDEIFLFGFSRGAYTCRVLAGMLTKVGLLRRGHQEMVGFAWELYKPLKNFPQAGRFKKHYAKEAPIRFMGLWDTVRSVGTPWRPRTFAHTVNNHGVQTVRHALALDERRVFYPTNLWAEKPPDGQDVLQVWFPGAHADVGGGYTGDQHPGLGAIPLAWMVRESKAAGVTFIEEEARRLLWRKETRVPKDLTVESVTDEFVQEPDHDEIERHMYWRLLEFLPLPRWAPNGQEGGKENWMREWAWHRGNRRTVPANTFLHVSVRLRQQRVATYRPGNVPEWLGEERFNW